MATGETGRITPVTGTEAARQAAATNILSNEIHTTTDGKRMFFENEIIAPVFHGSVANEATMLSLATSARGTWRADTCIRVDLANRMFMCLNNDGSNASDWIDLNNPQGVTGDVLYHNGLRWTSLASGSEGQVLSLSGGVPSWSNIVGGANRDLMEGIILSLPLAGQTGNLVDQVSSIPWTNINTVTSGDGNGARVLASQFTAANSEYFESSDPNLVLGDEDFSFTVWVYLDTKNTDMCIYSKHLSTGDNRSFVLSYSTSSDRFRLLMNEVGTVGGTAILADTYGAVPTQTWLFVKIYYNAATNTMGIGVNDGAFDTASHIGGVFATTVDSVIGSLSKTTWYWDGRIQDLNIWGRVLTSGEFNTLYTNKFIWPLIY